MTLSLKLVAEDQLLERALEGKSWSRSVSLEAVFPGQSEDPRELWRYDESLERAEFPPPELRAEFICFQYGAGKDLYALVFSWRAIEKGEWYEARVAVVRLRSSPLGNRHEVMWEQDISKLPLAPHSVIWKASILQENTFALIVLEGVRFPGGIVPPIIYVSLSEASLFMHSGVDGEQLGVPEDEANEKLERGNLQ